MIIHIFIIYSYSVNDDMKRKEFERMKKIKENYGTTVDVLRQSLSRGDSLQEKHSGWSQSVFLARYQ